MTKQSGLGDNLYYSGYDLSGDIGSIDSIASPVGTLNVTGINKSAYERVLGLRDGSMEYTSYFNVDAGQEHKVFGQLLRTDQIATYCRGTGLGKASACMVAKQLNYDPDRADDGALTFGLELKANSFGLEWGKQLTNGIRTDTTATNGTGVDLGSASVKTFGFQAYLQVFGITGTSATVKLQGSSDNGAVDTWADITGGAFAAATARGAQRIESSRSLTLERYIRVVTTGTFTNAQFVVVFVQNEAEVVF